MGAGQVISGSKMQPAGIFSDIGDHRILFWKIKLPLPRGLWYGIYVFMEKRRIR